MEPDELAAYIRSVVDLAPPLTPDQRANLASLLHHHVDADVHPHVDADDGGGSPTEGSRGVAPGQRQPPLERWLGDVGGEILGRVRTAITVSVQLP